VALPISAAAWPLSARAQQSSNKIPIVGVLWHAGSAEEEEVYLSVLVRAFNDLGYVEGKNVHLDHRFPAEKPERFRILAQELVDEKPDVFDNLRLWLGLLAGHHFWIGVGHEGREFRSPRGDASIGTLCSRGNGDCADREFNFSDPALIALDARRKP
jgi:hypothetical protein